MTLVTLTPDASSTSGPAWTVTGGASAHAVLADTSDTSYLTSGAGVVTVGFSTVTLPSGATVLRLLPRLRVATAIPSTGETLRCTVVRGGLAVSSSTVDVDWLTPQDVAGNTYAYPATQAEIDGVAVDLYDESRRGRLRVHMARLDVVYMARPTVAITGPSSPVTTTNQPLVQWAATLDADGGAVTAWQAQVLFGATVVADSGITAGAATSWAPTSTLANGEYTVRVRVLQASGLPPEYAESEVWSDWASASITVSVTPPGPPGLVVTPQPAAGQMRLSLTPAGSGPATVAYEVQRSTDAGATWTAIRSSDASGRLPVGTPLTDWEAPLATPVLYRARALAIYSGQYAASSWTTATAATIDTGSWWLRHPYDAEQRLAVGVVSFPSVVGVARQSVATVIGRADPVVVSDTRATLTGTITVHLPDVASRRVLDGLVSAGVPLLLHGPMRDGWDPAYVLVGDVTRTRAADRSFVGDTLDQLPITVVARPTGLVSGWPT